MRIIGVLSKFLGLQMNLLKLIEFWFIDIKRYISNNQVHCKRKWNDLRLLFFITKSQWEALKIYQHLSRNFKFVFGFKFGCFYFWIFHIWILNLCIYRLNTNIWNILMKNKYLYSFKKNISCLQIFSLQLYNNILKNNMFKYVLFIYNRICGCQCDNYL